MSSRRLRLEPIELEVLTMGLDVVYILTNMREKAPDSQLKLEKSGNNLPINAEQLVMGFEFPVTSYKLDSALISRYSRAVSTRESQPQPGLVPPLAIIAYCLAGLAKSISLPPGSIHASQEVESFKPLPIGSMVNCRARVAQRINRGKLHLLAIDLEGLDQNGEKAVSGKTTLILPG